MEPRSQQHKNYNAPRDDDSIAKNRVLSVTPAAAIPAVTSDYRETEAATRRKRLRRMADNQHAEALRALELVAARAGELKNDLGKFAPDAAPASLLLERLKQLQPARRNAEKLFVFLKELEEIAWSDATVFLEKVNGQVENAVQHDHSIAETYAAVIKVFEQRRAAIVEGKARASADAKIDAENPTP